MAYLTNAILKKPKTLIHTLIQKIIVYEDKVEIFYNYTDETNPGDDSPRDLSYYSGSDSSVIPESNTTNPNQNEKNYPKGSDSSVMVERSVSNTNLLLITNGRSVWLETKTLLDLSNREY